MEHLLGRWELSHTVGDHVITLTLLIHSPDFEETMTGCMVNMTFLVIDEPVNGPTVVEYNLDDDGLYIRHTMEAFYDNGTNPIDFDADVLLNADNRARIFGPLYARQPTAVNPFGVSYEDFIIQYALPIQVSSPSAVGQGASSAAADEPAHEFSAHEPTVGTTLNAGLGAASPDIHDTTLGEAGTENLDKDDLEANDDADAAAESILSDKIRNFDASTLISFLDEPKFSKSRGLNVKLSYRHGSAFDIKYNIYTELPRNIDLTAVEILTFFPGFIQDSFFQFRCLSAGWTQKALQVAHERHHHKLQKTKSTTTRIKDSFARTMAYFTDDNDFNIMAYHTHPVSERSKVADYSATGFAMILKRDAGWILKENDETPRRIANPTLSELSQLAKKLPSGDGRGSLTAFVEAYRAQPANTRNLSMLAIDDFITRHSSVLGLIKHDAKDDVKCARQWVAKGRRED